MSSVSALQDLLVHAVKGVGYWADLSRAVGGKDEEIDRFVIDALSAAAKTDSAPDAVAALVADAARMHRRAKDLFEKNNGRAFSGFVPAAGKLWELPEDRAAQIALGEQVGGKDPRVRPEIQAVRLEILKALKGLAVSAKGKASEEVCAFTHLTLANLINDKLDKDEYNEIAKEVGRVAGLVK